MSQGDQDFVILQDADLADFNPAGLLPQPPDVIDGILSWLDPTDYAAESSEYKKHLASYVPGTGTWIQESDQYQEWLHSLDQGALWIKATAGVGKSVVAAHTGCLLAKDNIPVLSFFFRQTISTNRTPQALIRDWLAQLLVFSPALQKRLNDLLEQHRSVESVALDELWEIAVSAISGCSRTYCIVDAIDEMDGGNDNFMQKLVCLGSLKPASIKLLVTSRPLPHIERALLGSSIIQLPLSPPQVDGDIAIYIRERLDHTDFSSQARKAIEQWLGSKSQGLFLYARLMLDEIVHLGFSGMENFNIILHRLPNGLGEMYADMLLNHSTRSGTPQELQLFILKCVTHSSRPLRLLELSTLVDFVRKNPRAQFSTDVPPFKQGTKQIVREACGPLLEILEDETVSIIHHSLTEFFTDVTRIPASGCTFDFPPIESQDAHLEIAKTCVDYLLLDGLSDWPFIETTEGPLSRINVARLKHPFLDYAAKYWAYHVMKCNKNDDELFKLLDTFLDTKSTSFCSYLAFEHPDVAAKKTSALHIAAENGLVAYTKHLLQGSRDINFLDTKLRTPLHLAAKGGSDEVVEQLLVYGCDKSMADYAGYTPIHLAACRNRTKVVSALLKSGVNPLTKRTRDHPGKRCGNARSHAGVTPLQYACEYGHTEATRAFLPFLGHESLTNALLWALQYENSETAVMIIEETEVDVNRTVGFKFPIHYAAWNHDLNSIRKLVARGADVKLNLDEPNNGWLYYSTRSHQSTINSTPLQTFARFRSGHIEPLKTSPEDSFEILKILVEAGCDLNEVDSQGSTAFHLILSGCGQMDPNISQKFVDYMFNNGADPLIVAKDGSTTLHLVPASLHGVIESLVAGGMDVNTRRLSDGRTPLFNAIGSASNISAYIKLGADCNAQDLKGDTVLHLSLDSLEYSYDPAKAAAIKTLLEAGADLKRKNKLGLTPIHNAARQQKETLLLLIAAGADLESRTDDGRTVLLWAMQYRHFGWDFGHLFDVGADVNARDFKGRTVLHYCCERDDGIKNLRSFVEAGADPKARDYDGNTLFHQVSRQRPSYSKRNQLALLEALLEFGVSPQLVNNAGQTPFHIAASNRGNRGGFKTDPFAFLLGSKCNSDVNASDNAGIRPIHLASALGEAQVKELLKHGADPMVLTTEGQSILHVASRLRQSGVVGLTVDLYLKLGQPQMVDQTDKDGRTALHYAARSGRPESVSTLINLGHAGPNAKDNKGVTPLGMCAYIQEENTHWSPEFTVHHNPYIGTVGVTLNDPRRPYSRPNSGACQPGIGSREIIKFLIAHGSDTSLLHEKDWKIQSYRDPSPSQQAISNGCEVLVDELLKVEALKPAKNASQEIGSEDSNKYNDGGDAAQRSNGKYTYDHSQGNFVTSRIQDADLLEGVVTPGENNITLFRRLLEAEHEKGIERFKALGADMLKPEWDGESCITLMVKGGYATMLEKFGQEAAAMTHSWIQATVKTKTNLRGKLQTPLIIACQRGLPNLEVIKVLVSKFKVDVDAEIHTDHRVSCVSGSRTALHVLATGVHWWNSHALEYLLKRGAHTDISDKDGDTPLHIAVANGCLPAVQQLLRHGADPNAINNEGLTCFNRTSSNVEIMHELIENGADVSVGHKPFIFNCIEAKDLRTVNLLAMLGADFNVKLPPAERPGTPDGEDDHRRCSLRRYAYHRREAAENSFPVHFAAGKKFNAEESKEKMIPIIEALLKGGADPLLQFNEDGDPILHDICERDGILEPFLSIDGLDLEAHDSKGRTLLLAACTTAEDWSANGRSISWHNSQPSKMQMLIDHGANIFAVDNEGRNLLYHLLTRPSNKHHRARHPNDLKNILTYNQASGLVAHKDNSGTTPLQHALKIGDLLSIDQLLRAINSLPVKDIANPAEPDIDGNTPLHHLAAQFISPEQVGEYTIPLVKTFIDLGVDINATNSLGETAFFPLIACSGVDVEHLKLFEEYGATLTVVNKKGQGLLHAAAKASSETVFEYLIGKGLNPIAEDDEMRSALDFATASDSVEILDMFKREGQGKILGARG